MPWEPYNPYPVGRDTGDCTVRALAKALDIDWEKAHVMLDFASFMMGTISNANEVLAAVLRQNGFYRGSLPEDCPQCYTAEDFMREFPKGTYVLGFGSHVATVKDGVLYDSWNSSGEMPLYYLYRKEE